MRENIKMDKVNNNHRNDVSLGFYFFIYNKNTIVIKQKRKSHMANYFKFISL